MLILGKNFMKMLPARLYVWQQDILGNEGNPSPHLGPNLEQGFPLGKIESQLW